MPLGTEVGPATLASYYAVLLLLLFVCVRCTRPMSLSCMCDVTWLLDWLMFIATDCFCSVDLPTGEVLSTTETCIQVSHSGCIFVYLSVLYD